MRELATPAPRLVRFGIFELDLHSGELRRAGARLNLPEQPFRLLTVLLERHGQLVTREELRDRIWSADTYVDFEHGLNAAIKRLRDVLGDSADTPRFIETLPRRGYRFIAEVSANVGTQPERALDAPQGSIAATGKGDSAPAIEPWPVPAPDVSPGARGLTYIRRRGIGAVTTGLIAAAVIALIAWWGRAPVPGAGTGAARARNHTRLTFGSGLQTHVTFSPDGKFIAYAADHAGNFDVWVQPVGGGNSVQVTTSPAQDTQPDWSPDGSTLVFRSEREGGGLFLVPALGGPERQLTDFGEHPRWSPDGSEILFLTGLSDVVPGALSGLRLFSVSPNGEVPRPLAERFLNDGLWRWVAQHPDGRISAVGMHRAHGLGFFTVSRDGNTVVDSKRVPLGNDSAASVAAFEWDRTGTMLYLEVISNQLRNLWRVRLDPQSLAWLTAERLTTGPEQEVGVRLSADGTRIAFSTQAQTSRVWAFPIDANAGRLLGPGEPVTEDEALAVSPALSPDGSMLSYELRRPGSDRAEIWAMNVESGSGELLATGAVGGCWSPDGRKVAYMPVRLEKEPWEYALAYRELGGAQRFLAPWTTESSFIAFDWTADGRQLLGSYVVPPKLGSASLALWPTGNGSATKPDQVLLSISDAGIWQARFSPNGRWISFVVAKLTDLTGVEMVIAPAQGTSQASWSRVAADHEWPDKPRWSPDGRILYFLSRRPRSFFNLWAVRIDPDHGQPLGAPFALTDFDSPGTSISPDVFGLELSISARRAVFTMATATGGIWMLDNVDR